MFLHTAGCVNHLVSVANSNGKVMFSVSFVCLFFCQQDYAKLLKPFSRNLLEGIWAKEEPINRLEQIWVKGWIREFFPTFLTSTKRFFLIQFVSTATKWLKKSWGSQKKRLDYDTPSYATEQKMWQRSLCDPELPEKTLHNCSLSLKRSSCD